MGSLGDFIKENNFPDTPRTIDNPATTYEIEIIVAKIIVVRLENLRNKWITLQQSKNR